MIENQKSKAYDLERRTFQFASRVNEYVVRLPKIITNIENGKQLIRSAGSVGANWIEATESFSKKDFLMRVKICRKEVKESAYWLLLAIPDQKSQSEKDALIQEAIELRKIFGAIVTRSS